MAVRPISLYRLIKRITDLFGREAAVKWVQAVAGYQSGISEAALRSALASKNVQQIEAVLGPARLQMRIQKAIEPVLLKAEQVVGGESSRILRAKGIEAQFNAMNPNVVLAAREQAATLVVGVPEEVKAIIREVIARGAERGLTVAEQAKAIKLVIGLPPQWAQAADNFAVELQSGQISKALDRKVSGALKQQVRSRAAAGTLDDAFIESAMKSYSESLIAARAQTIARTETQRAANQGLLQSWDQALDQGVLPTTTRVFWIVTEDDRLCPICARIPEMNADGRVVGEPFMTPEGLVDAPPAPHPNCRCTLGLGF